MKRLLQQADVPEKDIIVESASTDTLTSVLRCAEIMRALPASPQVMICTDRYHILRCRWLFSLLGIPTRSAIIRSARESNSFVRLMFWYLREIPATIWDTVLLLARRRDTVQVSNLKS
jgi:vancomycin permeability regulator SanA